MTKHVIPDAMPADPLDGMSPASVVAHALMALGIGCIEASHIEQRLLQLPETFPSAFECHCHLCSLPMHDNDIHDVEHRDPYWGWCCVCTKCARREFAAGNLCTVHDPLRGLDVISVTGMWNIITSADVNLEQDIMASHLLRLFADLPRPCRPSRRDGTD